jgi:WD40 repeat protein
MIDAFEKHDHDTFGFVNGDFLTGKILDLSVRRCFIIQYSVLGDLLAVGTSEGVALYETQTYSLVQAVERDDTVSALQWLQVPNGSLLLGVGGLNGVATLYSIDIDLLELQGAAVLQEFRLAYQIRAMTLTMCDDDSILWTVGDKGGTVTLRCFSSQNPQAFQQMEYNYGAGILGLAVNTATTLLALSMKNGEVAVQSIERKKDDSKSLGGDVYNVQRRGPVRSVVFTKDGKRLLFGGYDKTVVVVDTKLWAITRELKVQGTVRSVLLGHVVTFPFSFSKSNGPADKYTFL